MAPPSFGATKAREKLATLRYPVETRELPQYEYGVEQGNASAKARLKMTTNAGSVNRMPPCSTVNAHAMLKKC